MDTHMLGAPARIDSIAPGTFVAMGDDPFKPGPATKFGIKVADQPRTVFELRKIAPPQQSSLIDAAVVFAYPDAIVVPSHDPAALLPRANAEQVPELALIAFPGRLLVVGAGPWGSRLCVDLSDGSIVEELPKDVSAFLKWRVLLPLPFGESAALAEFEATG